jgi:hypothetical protein
MLLSGGRLSNFCPVVSFRRQSLLFISTLRRIVPSARGCARARLRLQMLFEPFRRQTRHLFERAMLFKEARRARNDLHFFFAPEACEGFLIQFNDKPVGAESVRRRTEIFLYRSHNRLIVRRRTDEPDLMDLDC